jgi:hypothetical protein
VSSSYLERYFDADDIVEAALVFPVVDDVVAGFLANEFVGVRYRAVVELADK